VEISKETRSDIVDYLVLRERPFHGNLDLLSFLGRVWNLTSLKAVDRRHRNAYGDIQTHVVQFNDWDYNYLLYDYLKILECSDEIFIAFIEMCLSPLAISDDQQLNEVLKVFNSALARDGYQLLIDGRRAGKPIYKTVKREAQHSNTIYEVALSYASEDRIQAHALAEALRRQKVKVFYDQFEKTTLWGKNLYTYLSDLYQNKAKYCVMFLSKNFAIKVWTNHERQAAQARAFKENEEYILPIRLDNTEIPALLPTIAYLDWHSETIETIVKAIVEKLGKTYTSSQPFDPENPDNYYLGL
jgi:AbiJ N-terminal domain 3/TIR domain